MGTLEGHSAFLFRTSTDQQHVEWNLSVREAVTIKMPLSVAIWVKSYLTMSALDQRTIYPSNLLLGCSAAFSRGIEKGCSPCPRLLESDHYWIDRWLKDRSMYSPDSIPPGIVNVWRNGQTLFVKPAHEEILGKILHTSAWSAEITCDGRVKARRAREKLYEIQQGGGTPMLMC